MAILLASAVGGRKERVPSALAAESALDPLAVGIGSPSGIAVGPKGEIYIASPERGRVFEVSADGKLRIRDYPDQSPLLQMHTQIGVDDCSTDLTLRGLPVFRGLIGPMPEDKGVVRYETPEVFETLTKEWSVTPSSRRRRRAPVA